MDYSFLKVFFYCRALGPPEATAYHHAMICLAEGFQALGISFYSNLDYWQTSPDRQDYLFQHNPDVTPNDCSIVIVDDGTFDQRLDRNVADFLDQLFHPSRQYLTIYIDHDDGTKTLTWQPAFRAPRLIDFGLIKVLNETADNANLTMVDDNRRKTAIGIEPWA